MLMILLSVSVLLCILAPVWLLRCNSNRWRMKTGQKKRGLALTVMLSLILAVTGCSGCGEIKSIVYNSSAYYDCMGYEIVQDTSTFDYYLRNTSTEEAVPLVRSPVFGVFSHEEKIRAFYVCPPYLHYTKSVTEDKKIYPPQRFIKYTYASSLSKVKLLQ